MTQYPDTQLCTAAAAFAKQVSTACLYNHLMRTFMFGELVGAARRMRYDRELFFVSSILHDLGLGALAKGAERFELEGADLAKEFLATTGMKDADIDVVWDAVAFHTTAGIPTRKRPEVALVQIGAGIDVGFIPLDAASSSQLPEILEEWPRLNFKREFPILFVELAKKNPRAASSHVTADICERLLPGFQRPHTCDVIEHAQFSE